MLLLDTCQSGGAVATARTARNPFALRGAIQRLARAEGAFSIAGAATSDKAVEIADLGHGVLTYSLLAGLRAIDAGSHDPVLHRMIHQLKSFNHQTFGDGCDANDPSCPDIS